MTTSVDETEILLKNLIVECHAIIREVVLPLVHDCDDGSERRRFLETAMELARTGVSVGDCIVRLRGGGINEQRQRITVERVHALSSGQGGGT